MTGSALGAEDDPSDLLLPDLLLAAAFARRAGPGRQGPLAQVQAGAELGGYRILHRLGSGGMGTVYVAEQRHPRRRVALKLLSPTGTSRAMVRRFQQEAQLLGSLQHPGIAQIHEAGTVELEDLGLPLHYLALELIEGLPLDAWVRERGLDLRARLELLARICDAVEHAHQRGVVHRDLKPANVLVVEDGRGGPGQPKVLDFGVARALEPEPAGARTRVTLEGQLVGTLAYMSPEQAAGDPAAIGTQSDVYALGVMLYRLVCGAAPIEVRGLPLGEATRRIREEAPLRPSHHARGLSADLDTIVLAALAKSRDDRYGSAAELAGDLRRHLRGEPIQAREHSALYLLGKALARNRLLVGSALAVLLLTGAFALVAGLQARSNRDLAASVRLARDRLARELRHSNLDRGRLFATAGHLQAAEDLLWRELAAAPDSDQVLWGLRDLYRRFPCLGTFPLSRGSTYDLVALPDGRAVSLGFDGLLREHRPPDFAPRETGCRGKVGLQRLRLTPAGTHLLHLDNQQRLTVIDVDSLEERFTVPLGTRELSGFEGNALASLGDARALVGLEDGWLLEVELLEDGAVRELARFPQPIRDLELAPSGELALGFADGSVELWDLARDARLWSAPGTGLAVHRMRFDDGGDRLHAGGFDRRVRVLRAADGALLGEWSAPNGTIRQIELDPQRDRALVAGWWSLDEWSLTDGGRRVRLRHPTDCFRIVAAGAVLLTAGRGLLRTWEARVLDEAQPLRQAAGRSAAVHAREGRWIAIGDEAGRLTLLESQGGAGCWSTEVLDRRIRGLAANADGTRLFVAGQGGDVAVVDGADGSVLERFGPVQALTRRSLALHPDGGRLAYGEGSRRVVVRELGSGKNTAEMELVGELGGLAWSPDGLVLALVDRTRGPVLFDPEGRELREAQGLPSLWTLCFAPDGRTLAASAWTGEVLILDARSLELLSVLEGHSSTPWDLAFRGADGRHLLSAAGDGTVRLWDLDEGRCLLVLDELEGWEALSVDVTPDGRRALLTSSTGALHHLDLFAPDRAISGNLPYQAQRLESAGLLAGGVQAFLEAVQSSLERSAVR